MAGYVSTWRPPPTVDDLMYEVQVNIWWGEKDRAKRQLLWIMDRFLGEEDEKAAFRESPSCEEKEGEDECYVVGRRGAD